LIYVNANNSVGIRTSAPSSAYALDVNGALNATSLRANSIESSSGTINYKNNTLSNILNLSAANVSISSSIQVPGTVSTSTLVATDIATDTLTTSNANYIQVYSGMRITGYSTSMYTSALDRFGTPIDVTRIGLRVNDNIMGQSFLSVSDNRIKTNVVDASPAADLQTVLNIPVYQYNMIDHGMDQRTITGFLAQEVEEYAPYAVRTTIGAIPNVMREPDEISRDGSWIVLFDHELEEGTLLKILLDDTEYTVEVAHIDNDTLYIIPSLPSNVGHVFVYGEVVGDFKLLDSERLLPVVFNAVKDLHSTISKQQVTIQNILARLQALENRK
jgi:hypothetical protein